ncbi:MAG: hypothetical protein Tsb0019_34420 [Roseibium sp.]
MAVDGLVAAGLAAAGLAAAGLAAALLVLEVFEEADLAVALPAGFAAPDLEDPVLAAGFLPAPAAGFLAGRLGAPPLVSSVILQTPIVFVSCRPRSITESGPQGFPSKDKAHSLRLCKM